MHLHEVLAQLPGKAIDAFRQVSTKRLHGRRSCDPRLLPGSVQLRTRVSYTRGGMRTAGLELAAAGFL